MQHPLPITVIIPTWNEIGKIGKHLDDLSEWIGSVNEVIVVDSNSTDGTLEYIQTRLKHPNLRIEVRPRGLYAAWNHAVVLATSKYINFATVGERISKAAMEALYENAERFSSDINISVPKFYDASGTLIKKDGPIVKYIDHYNVSHPHVIPPHRCLAWNLVYFQRTMIGSSASNLYLTEILRSSPFPEDVGHIGDSVFAVRQAATSRWLILPDGDSDFICHEKADRVLSASRIRFFRDAVHVLRTSNPDIVPMDLQEKLYRLLLAKKRIRIQQGVLRRFKKQYSWHDPKRIMLHLRKRSLNREVERLRHAILAET